MKTVLHSLSLFLIILILSSTAEAQTITEKPIRLAIAGMTHAHIAFILGRKDKGDFILSGVYEPNTELALRLSKRYGFNQNLIYNDLGKMLDKVKPEAVVAFGSVYEHMAVVEACAPRGVNVMVEKPLATNVKHAERMAVLAQKYNIHLLTDYETSWYPTTAKSFQLVNDSNFVGKLKKVVMHDGHQGPKEIGVPPEFLSWLTDPAQNGAGALYDFGCYGVDLMTWLMHGDTPLTVTAVVNHDKPEIYRNVDDDATIVLTYPHAQAVIQASWNWPFGRKDMEVYGATGYAITVGADRLRIRHERDADERLIPTIRLSSPENDSLTYLDSVFTGQVLSRGDLSALDTNVVVMQILDAARESTRTGKTVHLTKLPD